MYRVIKTHPVGKASPYKQWHLITPMNTIHWFDRKQKAILFMAKENGGDLPVFDDIQADYIVADPSGKVYKDGVVTFSGNVPPDIRGTFHFIKHAPVETILPFAEIKALGEKYGYEIWGRHDVIELEFALADEFLKLALESTSDSYAVYSFEEFKELVRVFSATHCGTVSVSHVFNSNTLAVAAMRLGIDVLSPDEAKVFNHLNVNAEVNRTGAIYLPRHLLGTVFNYPNKHIYRGLHKTYMLAEPKKRNRKSKTATLQTKTLTTDELNAALLKLPKPDPTSKLAYGDTVTYKNKWKEWGLTEIPFETFVQMITEAHEKQDAKAAEPV